MITFKQILNGSLLSFFIILFCIAPIVILFLPVIPMLLYDNETWSLFFVITVPFGIGSVFVFWEKGFDWAFDKFGSDIV